jgi:hypothetical protein
LKIVLLYIYPARYGRLLHVLMFRYWSGQRKDGY